MKWLLFISRILVGSLFIVSGLIKANDTTGFSYKLEEYFAEDVLNWVIFQGWEVGLAMIVAIAEILLGFATLAGEKFKLNSWALLILMIFFTFLTGYTAIGNWFFENPDTSLTGTFEGILGFSAENIHYFKDCGCFGDALMLTPFQSFLKDLVLLVFTVIMFIGRNRVVPNSHSRDLFIYAISIVILGSFSIFVLEWFFPVVFTLVTFVIMLTIKRLSTSDENRGWVMAIAVLLVSGGFTYYAYAHLPVEDFRPYAIGKNIEEGMTIPEGKKPPQYAVNYTMKDTITGKTKVVSSDKYLEDEIWKDKQLKIVETSDQFLVEEGYIPPIHDFVLEDPESGEDYTTMILNQDYVLFWVQYDMSKTETGAMNDVKKLSEIAMQSNFNVYGLTAALPGEIDEFRHKYQLMFPYLTCDATTLKTIIRSNPGLVLLKNGTVKGKWHHNDIPTFEELKNQVQASS
ncbi:DoxX family protein [Salibacter sp.]|uniref:DoxX family protein n=1 Tax=Salibacter sp. TaxID=2010995 RepID=UPI0028705A6A|nr:DoxX family protein [Salibacter sp.]MDR9486562.1 DoxX family protein [Salibacter sp.]